MRCGVEIRCGTSTLDFGEWGRHVPCFGFASCGRVAQRYCEEKKIATRWTDVEMGLGLGSGIGRIRSLEDRSTTVKLWNGCAHTHHTPIW